MVQAITPCAEGFWRSPVHSMPGHPLKLPMGKWEQAAKTMLQIQVAATKPKGEVVTPEEKDPDG